MKVVTEDNHEESLVRAHYLMQQDLADDSAELQELAELGDAIASYENEAFPIDEPTDNKKSWED